MKEKLRVIMAEDYGQELNALAVCTTVLKPLGFEGQWRVLGYLLVRFLGRSWQIAKPASDR